MYFNYFYYNLLYCNFVSIANATNVANVANVFAVGLCLRPSVAVSARNDLSLIQSSILLFTIITMNIENQSAASTSFHITLY